MSTASLSSRRHLLLPTYSLRACCNCHLIINWHLRSPALGGNLIYIAAISQALSICLAFIHSFTHSLVDPSAACCPVLLQLCLSRELLPPSSCTILHAFRPPYPISSEGGVAASPAYSHSQATSCSSSALRTVVGPIWLLALVFLRRKPTRAAYGLPTYSVSDSLLAAVYSQPAYLTYTIRAVSRLTEPTTPKGQDEWHTLRMEEASSSTGVEGIHVPPRSPTPSIGSQRRIQLTIRCPTEPDPALRKSIYRCPTALAGGRDSPSPPRPIEAVGHLKTCTRSCLLRRRPIPTEHEPFPIGGPGSHGRTRTMRKFIVSTNVVRGLKCEVGRGRHHEQSLNRRGVVAVEASP